MQFDRHAVIFITYRCNYTCPYCYLYNPLDPNRDTLPREIPSSYWIAFFNTFAEETALWDLTGGEPLLYSGLEELLEGLPSSHLVAITTNLSLPLERLEVLRRYRDKVVHITCSYHPSQLKHPEEFINKVVQLRDWRLSVSVNYVAFRGGQVDQISNVPEVVRLFQSLGIACHVDPYVGTRMEYTPEEVEFLKPWVTADRALGNSRLIPPPLCPAGYRYFMAGADGSIWRCLSMAPICSSRTEYLGSIVDGTVRLYTEPRPCPFEQCHAGCDYDGIRKVKYG